MTFFHYQKSALHVENIPVTQIAEKVGTPFYLYSLSAIEEQFLTFQKAFAEKPTLICYSMKCNSNLAIVKALAKRGGGLDIVSGGELYRALQAGVDPQKIVFAGVGKTKKEMAEAIKAGILFFNIESESELETLQTVAKGLKKKAPISLRVNPNIDPKTHPYISTGLKKNKFGIDVKSALALYEKAKKLSHIEIIGIDCHIGSQLTQLKPFIDAVKKVRELILQLQKKGIAIRYLDLGGGLGIRYRNENPPSPETYAKAILKAVEDLPVTLIFEPGRFLMGNSGVLITEVLYLKKTPAKQFVVVDAAMNDLIRPTLYESYHDIQPVLQKKTTPQKVNVVGPICESGDFFAQDRLLRKVDVGELLCIFSAGAYGFSMASNYNSRPKVAEVLVKGKEWAVIRERETYEDLIHGEKIPKFV